MPFQINARTFLVTVLALVCYPVVGARAETQFTDAKGAYCKDHSKEGFSDWVCPGPGGYAIKFTDEGNMVSLTIAPARSIDDAQATAQWPGANKAFGDKVEWIVRDGEPKAAIIRTWRRKSVEDTTEVQELSVFAINSDVVCSYAAVNARHAHANEEAAAQADRAADWRCPKK
jgi:hypothetical protein